MSSKPSTRSSSSRAAKSRTEPSVKKGAPRLNFDRFLRELKKRAKAVAKQEAAKFQKEANADANAFLDAIKSDLKAWTARVADGRLSMEDFEFLVNGKKDLAKMKALTDAGLSAVRIDRIRMAMIELIITAAWKLV